MEKYEVIIVGGGPAGATAGYILGTLGVHTLLLDKSVFPRRKLCGGALTHKTLLLLHRVFQETEKTMELAGIINYSSNEYDIYFKDRLMVHGTSRYPFLFVDRYVYDNFLLQKVKDTGVQVIEGDKVKYFDPDSNVLSTSSGKTYKARFIIGADGVHSVVRKNLPRHNIHSRNWEYNLATALEITIPRNEFQHEIKYPIVQFGYIDWGYSWIFPNKDEIILGLGGLNRKNNKQIKKICRDYISAIAPLLMMNNPQGIKIYGHPVPCGNYLSRPVYKNALLVGDAAGFSDPISGEGIYQAQRSAEIASMSIYKSMKDEASLEKIYVKLLKKHVFPDLFYAKILRWIIFNALNKLNPDLIEMLIKRGENMAIDLVHGLRTYKFLRRIDNELVLAKNNNQWN
jgi:geranylgeranyl reductase family protein